MVTCSIGWSWSGFPLFGSRRRLIAGGGGRGRPEYRSWVSGSGRSNLFLGVFPRNVVMPEKLSVYNGQT